MRPNWLPPAIDRRGVRSSRVSASRRSLRFTGIVR